MPSSAFKKKLSGEESTIVIFENVGLGRLSLIFAILFFLISLLLYFFLIIYSVYFFFFFFNDTATTEIYTLSLHDALPISSRIGVSSQATGLSVPTPA